MPFLEPPEIWMPQATAQEKKILRAIYIKICARRGRPSAEFIASNPNIINALYIQHEFFRP